MRCCCGLENGVFLIKAEREEEKSEWRVAFNKNRTSLKTLSLPLKDDIYSSLCTEKIKTQQRDWLRLMWEEKEKKSRRQLPKYSPGDSAELRQMSWHIQAMKHESLFIFSAGEKRLRRVAHQLGQCIAARAHGCESVKTALLNFSCISNKVTLHINIWRCHNLFDHP